MNFLIKFGNQGRFMKQINQNCIIYLCDAQDIFLRTYCTMYMNIHLKDNIAPQTAPTTTTTTTKTTTTTTTTTTTATTGGMVLIIRLPKVHEPSIVKCRKSRQYIILSRKYDFQEIIAVSRNKSLQQIRTNELMFTIPMPKTPALC